MAVDLEMLKKQKRELFFQALKGWSVWRRILNKYNLRQQGNKNIAVILMPENDPENSYFALLYIDRMLSMANYSKALILTRTEIDTKAAPFLCTNIHAVEMISYDDAEALLQLFAAFVFDKRFIVASLTDVKCRNGKDLLGVCGITAEEMVAIGVYRITPYVRKRRPVYSGDDPEIKAFMDLGGAYVPARTEIKIR